MIDEARVRAALATVRDPELDESITELGFVESLAIEGASVRVKLRLPTYFCAPNFAFLMASDAKQAVGDVDGVMEATVDLVDHFSSDEINEGLAGARSFDETFPGQGSGEGLSDLRDLFRRKAFISRQERLCSELQRAGVDRQQLGRLKIRDLPPGPDTERYLERRTELGLDTSGPAPLLVTPDGKAVPEDTVDQHLRFARTVGMSIDFNANFCRGLLETRYGTRGAGEART
jgi:metal-sulfur cluster biosynthetic enzyme